MKRLITICAAVLFVAGTANATPTVYNDRTAWETAVGSWTLENFDDGILNPDVSVASQFGGAIQAGTGALGPDKVYYDRVTVPTSGGYTTTWSFATPLYAFGADWDLSGPGGPGTNLQLYLNGVIVGEEILKSTAGTFWGLTNGPFDTILIAVGTASGAWAETYEMDDMVYAPIPAPGAILLGSIGVGLVGWLRRRRTL